MNLDRAGVTSDYTANHRCPGIHMLFHEAHSRRLSSHRQVFEHHYLDIVCCHERIVTMRSRAGDGSGQPLAFEKTTCYRATLFRSER